MKRREIVRTAACVSMFALLAALSANTSAQGSGAEAASAMASAVPTAREVRKANRALSRKVYAALAKHKEIDAGSISVVARSGAVTLNGTVTESSQIGTVAEIARGVPGVTSVTNRLSVQRPFGE
ncbi:BON domain-containing protein [Paraburkholderia guartelaensis]|uniref:BON domain-containing protein n=1 Tax=Paraburkholderia guartelaensis TaxID=2546446 RepID=UPI002AB79182|nr:BON domain-containing protein [Paraburkholderia guartelaensis]